MEFTPKIVDENKIPSVTRGSSEKWLKLFKTIPEGKAMVATEKEFGVKAASLSNAVRDMVKRGDLPPSFFVRQRKKGSNINIYVINSAKSKTGVVE
jgi:hypothetical protein